MSWTAKILATLAVAAAAVLAVIWLDWFRSRAPGPQPAPPPVAQARPTATNTSPFFKKRPVSRIAATNDAAGEVSATNTDLMTDWEDQIDRILGDDTEVEAKAKKMLEMFPRFPEDGQVEAAQHIANLLADEDYEKFGKYLTNATTPTSVQEVILADLLNRPGTIKLPLLLEIARAPANAKAGEARELLELYLEEDYGDDWAKWQEKMEAWLKENPD